MGILPFTPAQRRILPNGRVGMGEQARVGSRQVCVPLGRRHRFDEPFPFAREDPPHVPGDPLDFPAAACRDRSQRHAGHPVGMCLRIGQCEAHAPGHPPGHHPLVDPEMFAETLDIGDEVIGGVRGQVGARIIGLGRAASAAALIEQHRAKHVRVEVPARTRGAVCPPRSAVEIHEGKARRGADSFPVENVAVGYREMSRVVGLDCREQIHSGECVTASPCSDPPTAPCVTSGPAGRSAVSSDRMAWLMVGVLALVGVVAGVVVPRRARLGSVPGVPVVLGGVPPATCIVIAIAIGVFAWPQVLTGSGSYWWEPPTANRPGVQFLSSEQYQRFVTLRRWRWVLPVASLAGGIGWCVWAWRRRRV